MWTAPAWQEGFWRFDDLVVGSHVSGLVMRPTWPRALMKFADQVPIVYAASERNGLRGLL